MAVWQCDGLTTVATQWSATLTDLALAVWGNLNVAALTLDLTVTAEHSETLVILTTTAKVAAESSTQLATLLVAKLRCLLTVCESVAWTIDAVLSPVATNGKHAH